MISSSLIDESSILLTLEMERNRCKWTGSDTFSFAALLNCICAYRVVPKSKKRGKPTLKAKLFQIKIVSSFLEKLHVYKYFLFLVSDKLFRVLSCHFLDQSIPKWNVTKDEAVMTKFDKISSLGRVGFS